MKENVEGLQKGCFCSVSNSMMPWWKERETAF